MTARSASSWVARRAWLPPSKWAARPASAAAPCTVARSPSSWNGRVRVTSWSGIGVRPGVSVATTRSTPRLASRSRVAASSGCCATHVRGSGVRPRPSVSVAAPRASWPATSPSRPPVVSAGRLVGHVRAAQQRALADRLPQRVQQGPARLSLVATRAATVSGVGIKATGGPGRRRCPGPGGQVVAVGERAGAVGLQPRRLVHGEQERHAELGALLRGGEVDEVGVQPVETVPSPAPAAPPARGGPRRRAGPG